MESNIKIMIQNLKVPCAYKLSQHSHFSKPFSCYSFQAFRFAKRLSTAIRGTEELRCWKSFGFIPPDGYRDS